MQYVKHFAISDTQCIACATQYAPEMENSVPLAAFFASSEKQNDSFAENLEVCRKLAAHFILVKKLWLEDSKYYT